MPPRVWSRLHSKRILLRWGSNEYEVENVDLIFKNVKVLATYEICTQSSYETVISYVYVLLLIFDYIIYFINIFPFIWINLNLLYSYYP